MFNDKITIYQGMKKELLSCINNIVERNNRERKEKEERENAIKKQKELLDSLERERLMAEIHDFFRGFMPDRQFQFPLQWTVRREEGDEEYSNEQPYTDIKINKLKDFEGIRFKELQFGYDHHRNELYINGLSSDPFDKDAWNYKIYNHGPSPRSYNDVFIEYKYWSNDRLQIFVNALPWIENYIAKEYGCSNP